MSEPDGESSFSIGDFQSLDDLWKESLGAIVKATTASNSIPSQTDDSWNYYSTFKDFRSVMEVESSKVSELLLSVLKFNEIKISKIPVHPQDLIDLLTETNDGLLERINGNLDFEQGLRIQPDAKLIEITKNNSNVKLLTAKNVLRPQLKFKNKIDNSTKPFVPSLTEKPNSLKPLSILVETDPETDQEFYSHPYLYEIEMFKPTSKMMSKSDVECEVIVSTDSAEIIFVDSVEGLEEMINYLKGMTEIGVDLEAHSYRSFMGLTCLIQISSETRDYLIDPFPIWSQINLLNQIFTDPNILKIFHGSSGDIKWLQRDFSVYVVNMFDTYIACKILEFPRGCHSLKYLMAHYVSYNVNKKYQLADWRIRPLPAEMVKYAREDTRFLIPIYRKMKNELLKKGNESKNMLTSAYNRSNDLAKARFEKPSISDHCDLLRKSKQSFDSKQLFALKALHAWRNTQARSEDESEHFVLPTHMLLTISSELPREMQGIMALCNPVPPMVKQHLTILHKIILEAREQMLGPISIEAPRKVQTSVVDINLIENPLKCPLDFIKESNNKEDNYKPSLLSGDLFKEISTKKSLEKTSPDLEIFSKLDLSVKNVIPELSALYLSPFQRFKLLVPYMKSIEEGKVTTDDQKVNLIKKHFENMNEASFQEPMQEDSSDSDENVSKTDQERIESIKDHLDKLAYKKDDKEKLELLKKDLENINDSNEKHRIESLKNHFVKISQEVENKNNKNVESILKHLDRLQRETTPEESKTEVGRIQTKKPKKKKCKKRKSGPMPNHSEPKKKTDFANFDLSQFSKGPRENTDEYNPNKKFLETKNKNKSGRRFNKGANKSYSYKK